MSKSPKILFFDIETRPIKFWGWRTGKQYVDQSQIVKGADQDIICISYKWLDEKKIHSLDWGVKEQDSSRMIDTFGKVIESADVVIGHNADSFDIRHINTQRLLHGQSPIAWPTSEDTLKQIRKKFYLPSYRLDYISKLLTGSGKATMAFQDWIEIVENKSAKHLRKMIKYNQRDVKKLEEDYKILAPHLVPKANRSLISRDLRAGCPSCGHNGSISKGPVWRMGTRVQRRQCKNCGHPFHITLKDAQVITGKKAA